MEFAGLLLAAISPLYMMLRRHFDVQNANLETRIKKARELNDACHLWSSILEHTFDRAIDLLEQEGVAAAREEIQRQQDDFNALDYRDLCHGSEVLGGLRQDRRFNDFADACQRFYEEAIEVKNIAYGYFRDNKETVNMSKDGVKQAARMWKLEIEARIHEVHAKFRSVENLLKT